MKMNSFWKQNYVVPIYAWSDNLFKGTVVNLALPSLHGESLEIMLTVPLPFLLLLFCSSEMTRSKYVEGETVLCFQGIMIYEAKVQVANIFFQLHRLIHSFLTDVNFFNIWYETISLLFLIISKEVSWAYFRNCKCNILITFPK